MGGVEEGNLEVLYVTCTGYVKEFFHGNLVAGSILLRVL